MARLMFPCSLLPLRTLVPSMAAILVAGAMTFGCQRKEDAESAEQAAARDKTPPPPSAVPVPEARSVPDRLLEWLDPDATAVIFSRLPPDVDVQTLATVFALPPRVSRMLRDAAGTSEALAAIVGPDQPPPARWLGPEALAMVPAVGTGTYIVRPLLRPAAEVQAVLRAAGMRERTVEGMTMLEPSRALPWKLVFLPGDILGFIPATELGSGLTPLTAGRDLPPSEGESELRKALAETPSLVLEAMAAGPMLHLDLDQDILVTRFEVRPLRPGASIAEGLDAMVGFQPVRDPADAAKALEERTAPLETDVIQGMVDRVAFTVEGEVVQGRLQLTPQDVEALREAS